MCFVCRQWSGAREFSYACPNCGAARGATIKSAAASHNVMPDIDGYQSQVTGEWISSRSRHREHLREHRVVEIGNELHHLKPVGMQPDADVYRCPDDPNLHLQPKLIDGKKAEEIKRDVIAACYETGYWKR